MIVGSSPASRAFKRTPAHARICSVVLGTGLAAGAGLLQAAAAAAMDYKQALARKEARRAKLRNSAGDIKTSGKVCDVCVPCALRCQEAHMPMKLLPCLAEAKREIVFDGYDVTLGAPLTALHNSPPPPPCPRQPVFPCTLPTQQHPP